MPRSPGSIQQTAHSIHFSAFSFCCEIRPVVSKVGCHCNGLRRCAFLCRRSTTSWRTRAARSDPRPWTPTQTTTTRCRSVQVGWVPPPVPVEENQSRHCFKRHVCLSRLSRSNVLPPTHALPFSWFTSLKTIWS